MIASVAESGGIEMLVRNLSIEYARRGHSCHVVYISDAAALGASAAFERACKDALDAAGVTYGPLGHETRRNVLLGAWRLRRAVRRFRPDVVHMHLGNGLLFQSLGLVRTPTVYTHHNVVFRFPRVLFRLFDRFVDRYVGICEACAALLARNVTRPITLIHNGVPASFARAEPRTRLPRDVKILSVGNLTPQKDYPTLVAAAAIVAARLAEQGRGVRFSIAGEGGERAAIEREIAARAMGAHVELLGTRGDVAALMADADLLVLASRHEGLPITLIEAAMSGLPAVATDVGGCSEIVEHGGSGLLVPPRRPEALADAILAAVADERRYVGFSAAARRHGDRFTLSSCANDHLKLYDEIIGARHR